VTRYFAYGSNIEDRNMSEFCPSARPLGPGRLNGYRLEFSVYSDRWGGGASNIEPDEDGHVWGLVWSLEPEDVERLDTYEGHPTFYRREEVPVVMGDEITTCMTYRVAHQQGFVRPTDQYLNMVRSAMRVHGLPPEALDMLEAAARPPKPHIST
jgi:gamma-glutamylcyclotransferase (GGCT)/AIG2-like uncharacterized protein YtfP